MTPNEINLIKTFTELLEQKNEKIVELSIVEANSKIGEVRDNWLEKYQQLEETLDQQIQKYNSLTLKLKENGFIPQDVRDELGIVHT